MASYEKYAVNNLAEALEQRALPTVTAWNRLEGRPRRDDFDRALKAETRDAWWMLTRQWQIGEFTAEDAGSPIFAKAMVRSSPVTGYAPAGGPVEPFDESLPLEAKVEQRRIVWHYNGQKMRLDLRAQLGRHWRKLLVEVELDGLIPQFLDGYPFLLPARDASADYVHAHRRDLQQYAALAGRLIDGGDLIQHLTSDSGHRASDNITTASSAEAQTLDDLGSEFVAWFRRLYQEPAAEQTYKPEYLEYQFSCHARSAGAQVTLDATEYAHGHLDWHAFDHGEPTDEDSGPDLGLEKVQIKPLIPTPIRFEGMPDPRWWSLEDGKTDFGSIKPSTTDLAQLLLMEFGLVYANDWLLVPFTFPAGTLSRVEGVVVTNTFGERFWIAPAGAGLEDTWNRWAMFQLNTPGAESADTTLFIPPATARTLDGDPLEEVEFARDEVANMVWAVERTVPTAVGPGRSGKDLALETRRYQEQLIADTHPTPPEYVAPISYLAMTRVPEQWIPFMPVHVPGSIREIQLQRARMLRIIEGAPEPPPKVPPRTTLVRHGLDAPTGAPEPPPTAQPYFIHEEEVPRAGVLVSEAFRRTRWTGGQAPVWLGVTKQTGRGERTSGLTFDAIVNATPRGT